MALANYTDLQSSIANWLHRADLTAVIPDFIALTEERIARDLRIRKQVVNTTLTTAAGTQGVTLPSDFLEIENIGITSTTPPRNLHVVTPELMDEKFPTSYTGTPTDYTIIGDVIQFGPTPDAAYTVSMDYYQRLNLAGTNTNWLMTNHPGVYLFGALAEAAPYLVNDERAGVFEAKFQAALQSLNDSDDAGLRSGSSMRVRVI